MYETALEYVTALEFRRLECSTAGRRKGDELALGPCDKHYAGKQSPLEMQMFATGAIKVLGSLNSRLGGKPAEKWSRDQQHFVLVFSNGIRGADVEGDSPEMQTVSWRAAVSMLPIREE